METPTDRQYSIEHTWVTFEKDEAIVGISSFAQEQLGDIVYIQLENVGTNLARGKPFGIIESVKSVSDLLAPISGEIIAQNKQLMENPEIVNLSPYHDGWMIRILLSDVTEANFLLDANSYDETTRSN